MSNKTNTEKAVTAADLQKQLEESARVQAELTAALEVKQAEEAAAELARLEEVRQKRINAAIKAAKVETLDELMLLINPKIKKTKRSSSGKPRKARTTIDATMREAIINDLMVEGASTQGVATHFAISYGAANRYKPEAEKRKAAKTQTATV